MTRTHERRRRLAVEAARLISESGIRDFHQAKLKAAERLGIRDDASLPRNREIEEALREYQRIFLGDSQPQRVRQLREEAARAMAFFAQFQPRLVGPVLEGTADEHSAVCLQLYTDDPAAVPMFLSENGIPHDERTRRVRFDRERAGDVAVFVFSADGVPFDLTVLPRAALRQAPLDRIDEKPMRRASLSALESMLTDEDVADYEASSG